MQQPLLDHLDIWAQAIETRSTSGRGSRSKLNLYGIKKLRELILDLAVRGQLVPQDPNDEPARVLLEKIATEKEQLIKAGKIKKQKVLPPIGEDEKPFELPEGWEWARLGDICRKLTDGSHNPPKNMEQGYPMLSSKNVTYNNIDFFNPTRFVSQSDFIQENKRTSIQYHNILLTIVASLGRSAVVPKNHPKFVLQRSVAVLDSLLFPYYLSAHLNSPLCASYYDTHAKGTAQKGIYLGRLSLMPITIPPLAEQHRIVAKVNELMSLCDALEQAQTQHIQAHQTLVEHLLAALTQAANQGDFEQAWARIAEHFDTLFTTEHSIDQLKQSLLQLAVMGKLVPQDPNDEPASVLLEKIAAEKASLIKEKKIKKQKALPPIADEEKPFELPDGWAWCRLANVFALVTDGDHQAPPKSDTGIPFLVISNLNSGKVIFDGCKFVPNDYYEKLDWGRKPKKEDLLYTVTGSFGISVKNDEERKFCVQRHVAILKSTFSTPTDYLFTYLKSSYAFNYASSIATGIAQKTVPLTGLRKMLVALPPEKEQQKIIKKINQLTNLCDQLKTHLAKQQTTQNQLADALKKL